MLWQSGQTDVKQMVPITLAELVKVVLVEWRLKQDTLVALQMGKLIQWLL